MINETCVKRYCRDDLSKIENYEQAIADSTQTWVCHHRLELTLDGEFAHTRADLKRLGMYYDRPYFELIFLTPSEHRRLHHKSKKLPPRSDEHRAKISEALSGKRLSDEHRKKLSEALSGKRWKVVDGKRVWY